MPIHNYMKFWWPFNAQAPIASGENEFFENMYKNVENGWKKWFDQLLGARNTQKLVKIRNRNGMAAIPKIFFVAQDINFRLDFFSLDKPQVKEERDSCISIYWKV